MRGVHRRGPSAIAEGTVGTKPDDAAVVALLHGSVHGSVHPTVGPHADAPQRGNVFEVGIRPPEVHKHAMATSLTPAYSYLATHPGQVIATDSPSKRCRTSG